MRFGLAIASLIISGILLLLGIGQRTIFAAPDQVTLPLEANADSSFAVVAADEIARIAGQANVEVNGDQAFVAVGSSTDVGAWVAPFAHTTVSVDEKKQELRSTPVAAEASDLTAEQLQALTPKGSDLWLTQQQGTGRLPVSLNHDQSLLIDTGAGGSVSLSWAQDDRTPWAGPLLVAGGVFALVGLLLYLLAIDHDRRGLGPRRGRSGPLLGIRNLLGGSRSSRSESGPKRGRTSRRSVALPALGITAALALTGCSSSYWPDLSADPAADAARSTPPAESNVAPVPITQAQIDRIVADIADVAGQGDDGLDAKLLEPRFAGDAFAQRKAHYKIRSKVKDYEVILPRITETLLDYELVQSTEGWPRVVFVTVASETPSDAKTNASASEDSQAGKKSVNTKSAEDPGSRSASSPSLAMLLVQENPFDNYQVTRLFALRGGISMPSAAPVSEGTALLADDMQGLVLQPQQVGPSYAKVLAGGTKTAAAASFDLKDDTIIEKSGAAWVAAAKKAAKKDKVDVKYSVTAAQTKTPIINLSTGTGGALVSTTLLESRIEKQSGKFQPKAVGAVSAISGLKGVQKRIVSKVQHQLLFYVPSEKSGEKIQLLGYTTELVGASK